MPFVAIVGAKVGSFLDLGERALHAEEDILFEHERLLVRTNIYGYF